MLNEKKDTPCQLYKYTSSSGFSRVPTVRDPLVLSIGQLITANAAANESTIRVRGNGRTLLICIVSPCVYTRVYRSFCLDCAYARYGHV